MFRLPFRAVWTAHASVSLGRTMATSAFSKQQPKLGSIFSQSSVNPYKLAARYASINQKIKSNGQPVKVRRSKTPALENCPLKKAVVLRTMVIKPKKPNSALRKACRVRLSNGRVLTAYIPGEGHNIQEHSVIYVRGGRCQDLPGVKYRCIRGALDLAGVANRITSRSKYGAKKPQKDDK